MNTPAYRGRFAPSPSGPLHFGSLVAAVASFADARHHRGTWLVRIEDVDQTRSQPGIEAHILDTLSAFGMQSDEVPERQSGRTARYEAVLDELVNMGQAYRCNCSRATVAAIAGMGPEGPIYPGTCRRRPPDPKRPAAWRVKTSDRPMDFVDRILGETTQNLAKDIGDFVVKRIDGYTAYQLAVVIDDFDQGITDVVRGADLFWSTPRQIWLQQLLGFPQPRYAHLPLVYTPDGCKLSKADQAHPVDDHNPLSGLIDAWSHLGQKSPDSRFADCSEFWEWAIPHWDLSLVPRERNIRS